jgi:hypothetical protein
METAAYFARKHGLERYLDRPEDLNEMILKLLVLQETLQREQERGSMKESDGTGPITVRRTAAGRFSARCTGALAYRYAVETALKASTMTIPLFHQGRFTSMLRRMGVPEERIFEYCRTIAVDDDTHCVDQE